MGKVSTYKSESVLGAMMARIMTHKERLGVAITSVISNAI